MRSTHFSFPLPMQLRQLDTRNKRDVRQFVDFPFTLYQDCEQWTPPLRSDLTAVLHRQKHPFYEHSAADFFVVEENGHTLGRIAALENRRYNRYRQSKTAFFGYFEAVEDEVVARELLTAVCDWAHKRGLQNIIGPRGVIGTEGSILVEGFEHRPALTIPYNFPYYDRLIQANGFKKLTDFLSGYLPANYQLPERIHSIAEMVKIRRGYWIKAFETKKELRAWIPRILAVHEEAFSQTITYYPPTQAEVARLLQTLMTIVDPRLIKLVMKRQEIVGFIFAYPDVSAGLRRANGRLFPTGWAHILQDKRRTSWVNINGVGLLPKHQGLGGNAILYAELEKTIHHSQFQHVDVVQVNEANLKSFADMEEIGVQWYKRHRHYQMELITDSRELV